MIRNFFVPLLKEDLQHIVTEASIVSPDDVRMAEEEAKRSGRSVADVLIGKGIISEQFLAEVLSGFFNVPVVDLERIEVDGDAIQTIPEPFAKNKNVVLFAYDKSGGRGKIALLDPEDFDTINYLRMKLGGIWLDVYLTTPSGMRAGFRHYKKKVSEEFGAIIEENLRASAGISDSLDVAKMIEQVPIINILDSIMEHAIMLTASDVHFEPFEDKFLIRYRIDGIMQEVLSLPPEIAAILVARVKVMASMQIDIHSVPQDGRFRFSREDQSIDVRVSVIPTFHGEKVEMRLLKGSVRPLSLVELGLAKRDVELLEENIKRPHGMILVTGPTGMGKTTTLYAIIEILNTPHVNITTIEDPVEYDIPRVNQTQVNTKSGFTFANGLRALVRQNPDIIMVGEIRDNETADIAVNAALTGHLLLSTLHTNDAPTAVSRLLDFHIEPFLISSTLNMAIAQRLVRRICLSCITSMPLSKEIDVIVKAQLSLIKSSQKIPHVAFAGKGCKACSFTGYRGQIGVFEIFCVTDAVRELITKRAPSNVIRQQARKEGMRLMLEDGIEKVQQGLTTLEEVMRVTRE